jgi:RNA 2',3'-cyclic 3'-phosphodiesterase
MSDAAARKRRLFVGIELDANARARAAAVCAELQRTAFAAKYETPEKLHVTLAFLGFVEPSRFAEISAQLHATAQRSHPFAVTLDKLGAFPHERKPRVVFIGARVQGSQFRRLAANVRDAYAALGFEFDKDPVAHVTIARVKESKRPLPLLELEPIPLRIARLTLFESLPDPARRTSRYDVAATAMLGSAPEKQPSAG